MPYALGRCLFWTAFSWNGPDPLMRQADEGRATMSTTQRAMGGVGRAVDDRFGGTPFFKSAMKKVFPDHWTFLLGELALYSFVVLLVTGVYLTLFFKPSMATAVYHGSYVKLNGVPMSEAYASTLHLSFDVRGGL